MEAPLRTRPSSPALHRGPVRGPARRVTAAIFALTCLALASACAPGAGTDPPQDTASGTPSTAPTGYTVEHARGTAELAAPPVRVVTLEPVQLDTAVALGVPPVGATVLSVEAGVPPYLGAAAEAVQVVGAVPEPNLEAIAALEPDLVLGTESRHSDLYDELSAIAPTVFMATQTDPWQDNVMLVGRALGREAEAQELLDAYTGRCAELEDRYAVEGTAQLVRPRDGILSLYGPTSFAGSTLECVGFTIPERDWQDSISVDVSPERAAEAAADLVVVTSPDPSADDAVPEAIRLNEDAFGDLRVVDQSYWISGVGPLGGQAVLDDIETFLSDRASP